MIDGEVLYLAGLVSQATFALTIGLLAWSDQRTRGMRWLAGACGIQLLATGSRSVFHATSRNVVANMSVGLSVLLLFFVYMGMRWFVVRRKLESRSGPLAVAATVAVSGVVSLAQPAVGLAVAWLASAVILAVTVVMLLRTRTPGLRPAAHVCAATLIAVTLVTVLRAVFELLPSAGRQEMLAGFGREATMVSVTLMCLSFVTMFVAESKRRLHDESRIDVLTGLRNRRAMEEVALREVELAAQTRAPLALLMIDIDKFKVLNDTWGHALGDRALRALGSTLLTGIGIRDFAARIGGEEFAVLLPGSDAVSAAQTAERLRASVEALRLNGGSHDCTFTMSIGVSVMREGERGWMDMLHRADEALYKAKRGGRNRVRVWSEDGEPANDERELARNAWRTRWTLPERGV